VIADLGDGKMLCVRTYLDQTQALEAAALSE
jgi:hypothetical protein